MMSWRCAVKAEGTALGKTRLSTEKAKTWPGGDMGITWRGRRGEGARRELKRGLWRGRGVGVECWGGVLGWRVGLEGWGGGLAVRGCGCGGTP